MDFNAFKRLYQGDRVVFLLAMELFLEQGREAVISGTSQTLAVAATRTLSGFLTPDKIDDVIQTAKEFAALETRGLLSYVAGCFKAPQKR